MTEKKNPSKFTDAKIRNLTTEKESHCFLEGDGFGIRVYKTGGKVFFYQYVFDGKRRCLNLGKYDSNFETIGQDGKTIKSLAYHRNKYAEARNEVAKGNDPLGAKETAKTERKRMPLVKDFCTDEYLVKYAKKKKKSWQFDEKIIDKEIIPAWGKRKMSDIRDRDIKVFLDAIVERGAPAYANRIRSLVHMIFSFAVDEYVIKDNPCAKVKKPAEEKARTRYLSEVEIKAFWAALDGEEVKIGQQTRDALQIILLTAQRPGEVVGMHEKEIAGHWWTLPPERTKNKKEHRVYLSDTALEIIGDCKGRGYIFPAGRGADGHMTENALSFALRRNIKGQGITKDKVNRRKGENYKRGPYKTEAPASDNKIGVEMFSPHDLRRTAATLMAAIKVPFESRERVLNHSLSKLDGTYNQHDFDDEKQMAMESLERKIVSITAGIESNVVSIQSGKRKVA